MAFWKKSQNKDQAEASNSAQNTAAVELAQEPHTNPASANLSELVIRYIHEGVIIIDEHENILLANPASEEMIGRSFADMQGLNYNSVLQLLDKSGQLANVAKNPIAQAYIKGENIEARDLELLSAENYRTPVSIIATPISGPKSTTVITLRNIAKELEEERERNEFISTASHEMRTPVASMEGYLGLAMNPQTATIDERAKTYLTKAHDASKHLGKLFQDLLDTTKLDDGRLTPQLEPVEIVSLARKISDEMIPKVTEKGLGYQFGSNTVDQQLGGKRIEQVIYTSVDPYFLKEIIDNLVENAVKYTPQGWVTVNVRADQHNVQIIIADTGLGIAQEEINHIFQKFYRVDNSDTREIGGTGLGLYLVKQRVEAMNGRIWVESQRGKGSRFIVMFPRLSSEDYQQQKFLINNQSRNKVQK